MAKQSGPKPLHVDYQFELHGYDGEGPRRSHPALRAAVVLVFAAAFPAVAAAKPAWLRTDARPVSREVATLAPVLMTKAGERAPEPGTFGLAERPTLHAPKVR